MEFRELHTIQIIITIFLVLHVVLVDMILIKRCEKLNQLEDFYYVNYFKNLLALTLLSLIPAIGLILTIAYTFNLDHVRELKILNRNYNKSEYIFNIFDSKYHHLNFLDLFKIAFLDYKVDLSYNYPRIWKV